MSKLLTTSGSFYMNTRMINDILIIICVRIVGIYYLMFTAPNLIRHSSFEMPCENADMCLYADSTVCFVFYQRHLYPRVDRTS